jgi:hypothetical protein
MTVKDVEENSRGKFNVISEYWPGEEEFHETPQLE